MSGPKTNTRSQKPVQITFNAILSTG